MDNTHKIIRVRDHYEVYDSKGNFIVSGDTYDECYEDFVKLLVKLLVAELNKNERGDL